MLLTRHTLSTDTDLSQVSSASSPRKIRRQESEMASFLSLTGGGYENLTRCVCVCMCVCVRSYTLRSFINFI